MFRAAIAVAPVAMLITDVSGRLLAANQRWVDFAGPAEISTRPETWTGVLEPTSRRRVEAKLAEVAAGRATDESIDVEMLSRAGRRWTRWWMRREHLDIGNVLALVVVDIDEEVAQAEDLREMATHDHLTGLLNRRFFLETVQQSRRRAERSGAMTALLYVDLDGFKRVNDMAGHTVGDQVLAVVGNRLRTAIRGADVAARLGGDEFAVLLEDVSGPDQTAMVVERVESALADPVDVAGHQWRVRASVGVAMGVEGAETPEAWIHRADSAMYEAKRRRRASQTVDSATVHEGPVPTGPEVGPDPQPDPVDNSTLEQLRTLRDDLSRVCDSLDAFGEYLRAARTATA